MAITQDDVTRVLDGVEEPELHRSLVDLGMVRSIHVGEATTAAGQPVGVLIALSVPDNPVGGEIENRVRVALGALEGIGQIDIEFTALDDDERRSAT
ncbi:MAG: iron-sulfur cluster assembly protein [Microthrixaceae bacterium]